jgi:hypothetical protein
MRPGYRYYSCIRLIGPVSFDNLLIHSVSASWNGTPRNSRGVQAVPSLTIIGPLSITDGRVHTSGCCWCSGQAHMACVDLAQVVTTLLNLHLQLSVMCLFTPNFSLLDASRNAVFSRCSPVLMSLPSLSICFCLFYFHFHVHRRLRRTNA